MIAEGEYNFRRGAGRWWIPAVALRLSAVSGAVCFTNFVLSILPSGKREPVGTTEELLPQVCGEMDLCGDRGDDGHPRGVFCSPLERSLVRSAVSWRPPASGPPRPTAAFKPRVLSLGSASQWGKSARIPGPALLPSAASWRGSLRTELPDVLGPPQCCAECGALLSQVSDPNTFPASSCFLAPSSSQALPLFDFLSF